MKNVKENKQILYLVKVKPTKTYVVRFGLPREYLHTVWNVSLVWQFIDQYSIFKTDWTTSIRYTCKHESLYLLFLIQSFET